MNFQFWWLRFLNCLAILAILIRAGSILGLIRIGFEHCFIVVISILIDWFFLLLDNAFAILVDWWLPTLLTALSELFGFEITLYDHWRVFLVLMMFKCGSDVFAELKRNERYYAALWFGWGLVVSVLASMISGAVPLDHPSMLPILAPVVGFVVYGSGQAIWLARYRVPEGRSSGQVFRYYFFRFAVADGAIGLLCLLAGIGMRDAGYPNPNVLAFFLYLLGMACRDLTMPAWYVTFTKTGEGTWWRRYLGLATTWTGLNTMIALAAALLAMILNSGLVEYTGQSPC